MLGVLGVLNVLHVLNVPMDPSVACWALLVSELGRCKEEEARINEEK